MISNAFVPPFCATYPPTRCWAMCGPFQRRIQGCGIIVLFRKRRHENSVWKQLEKIEPSRCRSIRVDTSERPKDLSHIIFPSFALLSYKTVSIKQLQKKLKRYGLNMVAVYSARHPTSSWIYSWQSNPLLLRSRDHKSGGYMVSSCCTTSAWFDGVSIASDCLV